MPGPWLGRRARLQRVILPQCIDSGLDRAQGVAQQKGLMGVDAPRAGGGRQQLAGAIAACGSDYKGRSMKVPAVSSASAPSNNHPKAIGHKLC